MRAWRWIRGNAFKDAAPNPAPPLAGSQPRFSEQLGPPRPLIRQLPRGPQKAAGRKAQEGSCIQDWATRSAAAGQEQPRVRTLIKTNDKDRKRHPRTHTHCTRLACDILVRILRTPSSIFCWHLAFSSECEFGPDKLAPALSVSQQYEVPYLQNLGTHRLQPVCCAVAYLRAAQTWREPLRRFQ